MAIVKSSGELLYLENPQAFDSLAFLAAIGNQQYRRAAALYRGAFGEGIEVADRTFEEWLSETRRVYHEAAKRTCLALRDSLELRSCLHLAGVLLESDPLDEEILQLKIEISNALGDYSGALRLHEQLVSTWPQSLGRPWPFPRPSSTQNHVLTGDGDVPRTAFVGRAEQIETLVSLWKSRSSGLESVVLAGEAGIGKTSLADRFRRLLTLRGVLALWAAGHPLERALPFGVVSQWLNSSDRTRHPVPGFGRPTDREPALGFEGATADFGLAAVGRLRLYESIGSHIRKLGRPICLFIDDVQWADDASMGFVRYASQHLTEMRLMLVVTLRGEDGRSTGESLQGALSIQVPPLALVDVQELLVRRGLSKSTDTVPECERIHRRTGGNPLLLTALLEAGDIASLDSPSLPGSIVGFLEDRLRGLSAPSRIIMAALAMLREASLDSIAAVTQLGAELQRSLEELSRAGFISLQGDQIKARHGMMAEVAIRIVGELLERQIRGRVARLLHAGEALSATVALQYDLAGHSDKAYQAALRAARASMELFAGKEAEQFFRVAFANAPDAESKARIICEWSDLHLSQRAYVPALEVLQRGEGLQLHEISELEIEVRGMIVRLQGLQDAPLVDRARELFYRLPASFSPELKARLAMAWAFAAHAAGLSDGAREASKCTVDTSAQLQPGQLRIRVQLQAAAFTAFYISTETAAQEIIPLLAEAAPWPDILARAYGTLGSVRIAAGASVQAEQDLLLGLELIERTGSLEPEYLVGNNLGVLYLEQGRFEEAASMFERVLEKQPADEFPGWTQLTLSNLTTLEYERGEFQKAIERADWVLYGPAQPNLTPRSICCEHSVKGLCCLKLGRIAAAKECERTVRGNLGRYSSNDISYVEIFLARIDEWHGRSAVAIARLANRARQYRRRDFFCASRLDVERLRLAASISPASVKEEAMALRPSLLAARARPLVDRLDMVLDRLNTPFD